MMESLGNRLRQLRQNNRLRQDQVASLVGVNKNTMCSYENDVRQPSYEILVRLATIYRVSTDYLLGCESKEQLMYLVLHRKKYRQLQNWLQI